MTFHIITLFPDSFSSYLESSMLARAISGGKVKVKFYNPRDFSLDKHKEVDDKPYGGGPGMVIKALPVLKAVEKARGKKKKVKVFLFSPGGKLFDNKKAQVVVRDYKDVILICGRYEGIDSRVKKILKAEEISIGPYVLTGGELPAMIVVDVMARHLPGVLGNSGSIEENRIASHEMYTRPEVLEYKGKKYRVPKVLLSGDHKKIDQWREGKK